jgi:hypothetical protein
MKKGYCIICKKKLSKKKCKYCKSCSTKLQFKDGRRNYKGKNHPRWQGGFPKCEVCGKELSRRNSKRCYLHALEIRINPLERSFSKVLLIKEYIKNKLSAIEIGLKYKCSSTTIYKYLKLHGINRRILKEALKGVTIGNKNGRWIDGRSYKKYSSFFIALSKLIRKRDNYRCQVCGLSEKEYRKKAKRALDVHHIDHNKDNNVEDNLITICRKCHRNI